MFIYLQQQPQLPWGNDGEDGGGERKTGSSPIARYLLIAEKSSLTLSPVFALVSM